MNCYVGGTNDKTLLVRHVVLYVKESNMSNVKGVDIEIKQKKVRIRITLILGLILSAFCGTSLLYIFSARVRLSIRQTNVSYKSKLALLFSIFHISPCVFCIQKI